MSQGTASIAEHYDIMARIRAEIPEAALLDGVPDEETFEYDAMTGRLKPYMVITFGIPIRAARDRSILGTRHQPHIQPFVVDAYGGDADAVRVLGSRLIDTLQGYFPGDAAAPDEQNATEIELSGGGDYRERDTQGRPSRFIKRFQGEYLINMHTPDV